MAEDLLQHIESFVDGDLDEITTQRVRKKMEEDEAFARQVELAVLIKNSLSEAKSWTAPPSIERAVVKEIRSSKRKKAFAGLSQKLGLSSFHPRRAWLQIAGVLTIAIFAGTWAISSVQNEEAVEYSEAEIAQAEEDIRWVMAFVSETGLKTGRIVKEDVIVKRVVGPMQTQIKTSIINNSEQ